MEYQQMTIFDYLKPSLDDLDEAEMVKIVSQAVGLNFEKVPDTGWLNNNLYKAKVKHMTFDIHYSTYTVEPHTRFISCGWDDKKDKSGCGAPCDSIEKAIAFFKRGLKRL